MPPPETDARRQQKQSSPGRLSSEADHPICSTEVHMRSRFVRISFSVRRRRTMTLLLCCFFHQSVDRLASFQVFLTALVACKVVRCNGPPLTLLLRCNSAQGSRQRAALGPYVCSVGMWGSAPLGSGARCLTCYCYLPPVTYYIRPRVECYGMWAAALEAD